MLRFRRTLEPDAYVAFGRCSIRRNGRLLRPAPHNWLGHITGAGSAAGSAPVRKPAREQLNPFLEDVQYLAGHTEPRTTGLYDRRQKKVTRNIVEQISI